MGVVTKAGLIFLVIVSFNMVVGHMLRHAQFCGDNSTTNQITCPSGSVISIVEDTLSVCYKEYCGQNRNIYGQLKMALWESCHGKGQCTVKENGILASICSSEGNVLDFAYSCIDLYNEVSAQLGLDKFKNIKANKDFHVRSPSYPDDMFDRGEAHTYICSFRKRGQSLNSSVVSLQLQRVSLAKDSQLQIYIDDKISVSLVKEGDDDLLGQSNCKPITFYNRISIRYRQCDRNLGALQGSFWITMKASTPIDIECYNVIKDTQLLLCSDRAYFSQVNYT